VLLVKNRIKRIGRSCIYWTEFKLRPMHFFLDSNISNQSPISPVRQINHALKDSTTLTETVCNSSWELLWSSSQLSPNISSNAVALVCPYFAWAAALGPCYEPLKLPSLWMSIFCPEKNILACQRRVFRPSQHDTLATQLPHHVGKNLVSRVTRLGRWLNEVTPDFLC
jgi:hypothetical protein